MGVFVPSVSFFTSQLASSLSYVPSKWLEAFNTLTAQIYRESFGANAVVLRITPNVIRSAFTGNCWSLGLFTLVSFRVELGSIWTSHTVFLVQVKDWFGVSTTDTLRIRSSQKGCFNGTVGDVVISDELEEIFIVVIDGLVTDDPVGCFKISDVFIVGLGF